MKSFRLLIPAVAMAVLILDAQTALSGAQAGLELCFRSVIPSLFPFLFLSAILSGTGAESLSSFLSPLGQLCRIPKGAESILIAGLISGYPVGAQCIAQAYREGRLDRETAQRMLGFCSNAGPSFIFGFLSTCFAPRTLWLLWGIHIISAILTGILLPGGCRIRITKGSTAPVSPVSALEQSVRTITLICGWVVIFRVLLTFLRRWILWLLPIWAEILLSGLLELTNGCSLLALAEPEGLRFILASVILSFGGVCVWLQTATVTKDLGTGLYLPGKIIQAFISAVLAGFSQYWFDQAQPWLPTPSLYLFFAMIAVVTSSFYIYKKRSSFLPQLGV